jgi:Kef-type K+ transport system membrane component KefB
VHLLRVRSSLVPLSMPETCAQSKVPGLNLRLALAIGMWPRGEVGAGVLIVSLGYGLGGPMILAAMLSLALKLLLTGVFILVVKRLVAAERTQARAALIRGTEALHMNRFDRVAE